MKAIRYYFSILLVWLVGFSATAQNTTPKFVIDYNNADSTTTFKGISFVRNGTADQYSLGNGGQFQDQFDLSKVKSISRYYEQPITHVYTDDNQSEAVVNKVKNDGTVVLESGARVVPKVGEIIASAEAPGAPDGFLLRVEEVTNKNGQVELKTSQAYLNELFDEVNVSIPLQVDKIESFVRADGKKFYPRKAMEQTFIDIDTTYVIATDTIKNLQSESWLKDFKAELGIKLGFKLNGTFVMEKKSLKWSFERLGFELDGKISADVNVKLSVKKKFELLEPMWLGTVRMRKVVFSVGVVPVVLRPEIDVYFNLEADGSLSLTFTPVKFSYDCSFSTMYTDEPDHITGKKWNTTKDFPNIWDAVKKNFTVKGMLSNFLSSGTPDFSMKGNLKASIKPAMKILFYGSDNMWMSVSFVPYAKLSGELTVKHTLDFGDEDYDLGGNFTVTDNLGVDLGLDLESEARTPFKIPFTKERPDNIYALPTVNLIELRVWTIASLFPTYNDFWLSPEKNAKSQSFVHLTVNKEKPTWVVCEEDDFGFCYRTKGSNEWTYISLKDKYADASYGISQSFLMQYDLPTDQLQDNKTYIVAPYTHIKAPGGGFYILRKGDKFKTGENDTEGGGNLDDVPGEDF